MRINDKGKVVLLFCFALFLLATVPAQAADEVTIKVAQREIPMDTAPFYNDDVLLAPLRQILESIGITDLVWDQEGASVQWTWEDKTFFIQVNNPEAYVAGEVVVLSQAPILLNGHTFVPADFIEEFFPVDLGWDTNKRQLVLANRGGRELIVPGYFQRQAIIETALKYQGVPYKWGGTGPSGFDSSGFIWYVFKENGIQLPRVSFDMYAAGKAVAKKDLLPGDLVFFEGYRSGPSHGTIYIGDGRFIHAPSTGSSVSIDSIDDPNYWAPKYYGSRRIIE
ncbi:MAG: NlpC/P60 family protein [bacterium]